MNHYKLILKDKDSDAREERAFDDAHQGRLPSTEAIAKSRREAIAWGRYRGLRYVLHEIVDSVTGRNFGRYCVPIRHHEDSQ